MKTSISCSAKPGKPWPSRVLLPLLLFGTLTASAQSLTGLWVGNLRHDSNSIRQDQSFEIALTEYRGKVYGYSRSEFIINDTLYYILKRVKGTIKGDLCEVTDDEIVSYNFRGKLDKGVKVTSTFRRNRADSTWYLDGTWKTKATREFYAVTGKVSLEEEKDLSASKIFPHLEELNKADQFAFYQEKKSPPPPAQPRIVKSETELAGRLTRLTQQDPVVSLGKPTDGPRPGFTAPAMMPAPATTAPPALTATTADKETATPVEVANTKVTAPANTSPATGTEPAAKETAAVVKAAETPGKVPPPAAPVSARPATDQPVSANSGAKEAVIATTPATPPVTPTVAKDAIAKPAPEKAVIAENKTTAPVVKTTAAPVIAAVPVSKAPVTATAPALSDKTTANPSASVSTVPAGNEKITKPAGPTTTVQTTPSVAVSESKPVTPPPPTAINPVLTDVVPVKALANPQQNDMIAGRRSEYSQQVTFSADSLRIVLFDNGEIDGDTVSVYLNGELIMPHQGLKASAIRKTIAVPREVDSFAIVMFAESLGTRPPNTGLLVVHDGEDVYYVRFSSDFQKSTGILFKRKQ